jgi:hypothetical protein
VLADHAARILPRRPGLGPEARGVRGDAQGSASSSVIASRTRLVSGTSAVGMSQYSVSRRAIFSKDQVFLLAAQYHVYQSIENLSA